ncbi:hypothetical protein Gotri_019361 [Gossypium trilobum]|uniref:Uncharacterized protein n=1 Tax=Gossypium trilobum TaxID=34281 RepID=A0A7J9ECL1_9ROSI|nr:hypothetical protein [Gossypium trilobum]
MSSSSQSSVSSQNSRGTKKKWFLEEDVTLVVCMVDLYNVGIYNANTGFKADYLNKLERMLEKVLPHAMLKARYNLGYKAAKEFRHHNFPYYDQLTSIYAKDRATGKDA